MGDKININPGRVELKINIRLNKRDFRSAKYINIKGYSIQQKRDGMPISKRVSIQKNPVLI